MSEPDLAAGPPKCGAPRCDLVDLHQQAVWQCVAHDLFTALNSYTSGVHLQPFLWLPFGAAFPDVPAQLQTQHYQIVWSEIDHRACCFGFSKILAPKDSTFC